MGACGSSPIQQEETYPKLVGGAGIDWPMRGAEVEPVELPGEGVNPLEEEARTSLRLLRARAIEENLADYARVVAPDGPQSFGETISISFEIFNVLGSTLVMPAPPEGLRIELQWEIERWLPFGARDTQSAFRVARLPDTLELEPGGSFRQAVPLPLDAENDPSALWVVLVGARLRLNGVQYADQRLPVREVPLKPARILVLPPGWAELQADPLGNLQRLLGLPQREVDRHVLVSAALLAPSQKDAAIELLMASVNAPVNEERGLTAIAALVWLTGQDLGPMPAAWNLWYRNYQNERYDNQD